jgi:hypothetical protein
MNPLAQELVELWSAGAPIAYVVTAEEDRAIEACRQAARAARAGLAVGSAHRGLDPIAADARDPLAALDAVTRAPAPILAVLLDFHHALAEPSVARALRDAAPRLAAEGRCVVVVAPRLVLPDGLEHDTAVLRLPLPTEAELGELLDALAPAIRGQTVPAAPLALAERHRVLVAARGLAAAQARRAFTRALRSDASLGDRAVAAVLDEKKRVLSRDLGLELVDAPEGVDGIGGLDAFKGWTAERALAFGPDAELFGLPPPRGVLLVGVQGCGKSLAAKAAADRLGVPLLRLDLPRVLGAADRAEESLARALDAAEAIAPVALWVDEIEKGFAGSVQGQDPRAARLLGAFSTWLQERRGAVFVVATANDVTRLPPELLRRGRFDELFFVDLPDLEARREILKVHLARRGREPAKLDVDAVAQLCADYSGAELEQVVVGALHRAFAHKRDVETQDLRRVAQELVPLFKTYEEQIKALREWARGRARPAGREGAIVDLFRRA